MAGGSARQPAKGLSKSTPATSFGWLKVNFGEAGFFRTEYSPGLLERLKTPVETKLLPPRDRLGIIRDLFALAEAGIIPTTKALEFLPSYKDENDYTVWLEIATSLSRLEQTFFNNKLHIGVSSVTHRKLLCTKLDEVVLELFSPLARKLGWEKKKGEKHGDILLRPLAISRAGRSGDQKIITEARKKFALLKKGKHLDPDLRGAVYSIVAKNGGAREYKILTDMYKQETLHEEKNRIGGALGNFQNERILKRACEFAMSTDVRPQDTVGILSSVGTNPLGRSVWLDFIKKNWQILSVRYGEGGHALARLVKAISGSAEEQHFKSFKKFFATHKASGAKRAIEQVLERMEGNIAWRKRDGANLIKFFS